MGPARLLRCPRCGGKVFVNAERDGLWAECLPCGWEQELSRGETYRRSEPRVHAARLSIHIQPHTDAWR